MSSQVKYNNVKNIFSKYGYQYQKQLAPHWYDWKHENPVDYGYRIEINPLHNHLIIYHNDEEGNKLKDIEPIQIFFDNINDFESIIKGLTHEYKPKTNTLQRRVVDKRTKGIWDNVDKCAEKAPEWIKKSFKIN